MARLLVFHDGSSGRFSSHCSAALKANARTKAIRVETSSGLGQGRHWDSRTVEPFVAARLEHRIAKCNKERLEAL